MNIVHERLKRKSRACAQNGNPPTTTTIVETIMTEKVRDDRAGRSLPAPQHHRIEEYIAVQASQDEGNKGTEQWRYNPRCRSLCELAPTYRLSATLCEGAGHYGSND